MICAHLRLSDSMSMVYSINDICAIRWKGDSPEQVTASKVERGNILDTMEPKIKITDEALKYILYDQLKGSQAFDSEVKH